MPPLTNEATQLRTLDVPAAPTDAPVALARANMSYVRVLVKNVGPTTLFITVDAVTLQDTATPSEVWVLDPHEEDVLPICPSQTLYCAGVGGGGRITVCVSPALPLAEWMRS